jgi:hypothetical protein
MTLKKGKKTMNSMHDKRVARRVEHVAIVGDPAGLRYIDFREGQSS